MSLGSQSSRQDTGGYLMWLGMYGTSPVWTLQYGHISLSPVPFVECRPFPTTSQHQACGNAPALGLCLAVAVSEMLCVTTFLHVTGIANHFKAASTLQCLLSGQLRQPRNHTCSIPMQASCMQACHDQAQVMGDLPWNISHVILVNIHSFVRNALLCMSNPNSACCDSHHQRLPTDWQLA